jgi:hypothetical protein
MSDVPSFLKESPKIELKAKGLVLSGVIHRGGEIRLEPGTIIIPMPGFLEGIVAAEALANSLAQGAAANDQAMAALQASATTPAAITLASDPKRLPAPVDLPAPRTRRRGKAADEKAKDGER